MYLCSWFLSLWTVGTSVGFFGVGRGKYDCRFACVALHTPYSRRIAAQWLAKILLSVMCRVCAAGLMYLRGGFLKEDDEGTKEPLVAPHSTEETSQSKLAAEVIMFSVGSPMVAYEPGHDSVNTTETTQNNEKTCGDRVRHCQQLLASFCNPIMYSLVAGLLIGLIEPIQGVFYSEDAQLRFLSSAVETMGKPTVGITTLLMSASLGGFITRFLAARSARRSMGPDCDPEIALGSAATAVIPAFDVEGQQDEGNVPEIEGEDTFALEGETPGINSGSDTPACVLKIRDSGTFETDTDIESDDVAELTESSMMPMAPVVGLAVVRVLVLPLINMSLVLFLADYVLPDTDDRGLMKLVLMVEAAVPGADSVVVVCQQFGQLRIAEGLAASYLFQYLGGLLSLGIAISISLNSFF